MRWFSPLFEIYLLVNGCYLVQLFQFVAATARAFRSFPSDIWYQVLLVDALSAFIFPKPHKTQRVMFAVRPLAVIRRLRLSCWFRLCSPHISRGISDEIPEHQDAQDIVGAVK